MNASILYAMAGVLSAVAVCINLNKPEGAVFAVGAVAIYYGIALLLSLIARKENRRVAQGCIYMVLIILYIMSSIE